MLAAWRAFPFFRLGAKVRERVADNSGTGAAMSAAHACFSTRRRFRPKPEPTIIAGNDGSFVDEPLQEAPGI
jgi:hypothetical protein